LDIACAAHNWCEQRYARRTPASRPISKTMISAAEKRGISVQALVRRPLAVISKRDLFDEILGPTPAQSWRSGS
jgi:hypothetical protein